MQEARALRRGLADPADGPSERQRFAELFEHARDAYLITASGGEIREANFAARELLGADPEALHGASLIAFVRPTDRAAFRARVVAARGHPRAEPLQWPGSLAGSGHEVIFRARAIKARQKNAQGLCWLLRQV